MNEPKWVLNSVVYAIHQEQLTEHGGGHGIRDENLLESALKRPENLYHYADPKPTLFALAACYAFGIVKNHPFIDGNKRVGLVVSQLFLRINAHQLETTKEDKYQTFINLAAGSLSEKELANWFSNKSQKAPSF